MSGMDHVRLATYENSIWNYREFTDKGGGHFAYDVYLPANTSYDCQWNIYKYGGNWSNTWYIWDGSNDNPYTARSGKDGTVARMCFWGNSSSHGTSNSFTTATASSGFTHLYVDFWGSYEKDSWKGVGIKFWYAAVAALSPSLEASTGTSKINPRTTSTITASCTGGSESYNYSYVVTCGGDNVTASTLSATSGESVTFTAPAAATEKTYRITVTASDANSQLSGLATQTAYKDITVNATGTPTVTLNVDKINVNQIKVTGTITGYANYGTTAADMTEVGFYFGNTKYTTTYKSGSTFTKTITSLAANTSYDIKAFATNPCYTGYSDVAATTTLANANYRVKVRVASGATAPKVYAWTDADGYGGAGMANGTYGSQSAISKLATGTTYDWYYCDLNNCYEKFLIYTTGDVNKTDDIAATRTSDCFWYNAGAASQGDRKGKMDCPIFEPNVYIETTAGGEDYDYNEMSTSPTISKTLTLAAKSTYKFKILYNAEYYGKASTTLTRASSSASSLAVDGAYMQIVTDAAGDYTFTYTPGTKTVAVTYPVVYAITLKAKSFYNEDASSAVGTDGGTVSAEDNYGATIVDGDKVQTGGTVTFTATPKDGYTFAGWYEDASCETEYDDDDSDVSISGDDDEVLELSSITAAKTVYAKFAEKMTTVALNSTTGGHIEISSSTVTSKKVGKHTTYSLVAVPDSGYYFTGWTKTAGTDYTISSTSTATTTLSGMGGGSTSGQTLTANFDKRWIIAGDWEKDGGGSWVMTNKMDVSKISNTTFVSKRIDGLTANTDYDFKLYDLTGGTHWVGFASSGEVYEYEEDSILVNSYPGNNIKLKTAAQGNYYFYYNLKTHKLYISFPASRQVTMGIRTISDGVTSAYTGGTISAVDEKSNVITTGLYILRDDNITFTASPKAGYIWRGWYNSSGCTGEPVSMDRVHTDADVTSDLTRYALFEEALYNVKVHTNDATEITEKVGVDTHPEITAGSAPTGKIFDRWVTTGSATVADAYASTTTITGATDDASTVTATFKELPKIYIDMTAATGWSPSNMYVVFYKNGGYFDGTAGTGLSSTYVINPTPLEMTKMGDSKIWYYSYDPTSGDFADKTITCVTFIDHTYSANYGNFTEATAVYRTDFSSCMNMFVVTDNTGTNKNTNCYYRNTNAISGDDAKGYWRKYEEKNSGFYLNNLPGGSVEFTNEDGGNSYTAVANLDANTNYYFYLGGCNGWNWSNKDDAFNSNNRTRELVPYGDVSSDGLRCHLTTTAAGYYTFTLTPLNTGRKVQVSVAFPVAANDYRAVYNNAASSPTISRPSNIIKNDQNSGTISLWLNKGTNYISFQKASVAGDGAVSWSACGSQQTVSGVAEAGIYTMTLTRNNTTYTVSTPEAYTGDLYIRTDCAPGKWADYTENKLTENTFNFKATDPNTYDYYYCKWINDAGTNVRCVIANDINVAISDTLKTEAILGGGETLPEGANVRFSYNSITNTLKRSYLTGASTDVFLNIMPDAASKVYQTDGTTDMYNGGAVGATNKFSDLGNWVYELNVKVKPNATAAVKANYNSTSQALIASGTTLVGGTGSDLYSIRLVYDFRTNNLMSAWMPNGDVGDPISLNSDMMIVRRGQNEANQLSFSDDGALSNVKRAYGVFEFNKSEMVDRMSSWSDGGTTYGLCMYYFSLPFDVNVADIFGVGTMGDDWRIQFYNGTKRAAKGWFAGDGTTTFWEDVPADTVLHAYEGYCLMLNRSHFNSGSNAVWNNVTTNAYLYFPSVAPVAALKDNEMEITVPSHECKIDRFFDQDRAEYYDTETKTWKKGARNHKYVDSHWNLMGTPLFENATATGVAGCTVKVGDADSTLTYIYEWVPSTNSLSARQVLNTSFTFKPMYAYMVQYSGKVTFTGASITPSIAARRISEDKQYTIDLLLTQENKFAGRTYVELRENAVDSFMLNEDMYMMKGSKIGDIYTHADGYELAANVLSVNSHIVPVSVDAKLAGTYTISMPSNFDGTVTLVDTYANTRTNLALENYEVNLEKGTIQNRFYLEIDINKVTTDVKEVMGDGLQVTGVRKYIYDNQLYIMKNGIIYDARGNRVK